MQKHHDALPSKSTSSWHIPVIAIPRFSCAHDDAARPRSYPAILSSISQSLMGMMQSSYSSIGPKICRLVPVPVFSVSSVVFWSCVGVHADAPKNSLCSRVSNFLLRSSFLALRFLSPSSLVFLVFRFLAPSAIVRCSIGMYKIVKSTIRRSALSQELFLESYWPMRPVISYGLVFLVPVPYHPRPSYPVSSAAR